MERACGKQSFRATVDKIVNDFAEVKSAVASTRPPILYHDDHNIRFWGLEKLHPFDSTKFSRAKDFLEQQGAVPKGKKAGTTATIPTAPVSNETLLGVHIQDYLDRLKRSTTVAGACEFPPIAMFSSGAVQRRVVQPMRRMVSGTILALALALERGWAINLGGGMHHAEQGKGKGWCVFADIPLAIKVLSESSSERQIQRVMVVDLDVHQGDGVELVKSIWQRQDAIFIFDMFNPAIFPGDKRAERSGIFFFFFSSLSLHFSHLRIHELPHPQVR